MTNWCSLQGVLSVKIIDGAINFCLITSEPDQGRYQHSSYYQLSEDDNFTYGEYLYDVDYQDEQNQDHNKTVTTK